MSIYWLTRIANFQGNSIRLLDINTGIEFLAEDILMLVCPGSIDKGVQSFVETLPVKLRRKRHIFTGSDDSKLQDIDTLCWLALKYIFNLFGYEKHRDFVRWLRKDVAVSSNEGASLSLWNGKVNNLSLSFDKRIAHTELVPVMQPVRFARTEFTPNRNVSITARLPASELIVTKLNSLHWFNIITNCQLLSLSDMYLNSHFSLVGAPPTLVPAIQNYYQQNESLGIAAVAVLEVIYLSFLYKRVDIPSLLETDANLSNQLLRKRYLDCCQFVLENQNISYPDLYFTFITDTDNLFLAQELDLAIIFSYFKKNLSFPILRALEGGVFLQALDLCGLTGSLDNQLVLSLKVAYLNWLSTLLSEIISST
ncbi:MAG: hypothetical protein PUP92_06480 [Rhizonema sp. PD38]|nr:hypothetical protein [Rhizonema sp. PD38]